MSSDPQAPHVSFQAVNHAQKNGFLRNYRKEEAPTAFMFFIAA